MTVTPPWQGAYDQFRQLYPTGGLLLDLVATPTPDFAQYVVKATAQVGHLTLLSVLGEASNLLGAETQACEKLFQVLKLVPVPELSTPVLTPAHTSPPPELRSRSADTPPEPFTSPQSSAQNLPPDDRPPIASSPVAPPIASPASPDSAPGRAPKSEPYRLPQPLSREEILAPEVDDWSEELAQIEAEIKRLGWTPPQESQYLQERYGKLSRDHITDYGELLQFLTDLQGQPSPQRKIEPWSPAQHPPHPVNSRAASFTVTPTGAFAPPVSFGSREEMMEQVLAEIGRIGWTARKGSEYLQQTYHVKTRQELTDEQLQAFILYLQRHP